MKKFKALLENTILFSKWCLDLKRGFHSLGLLTSLDSILEPKQSGQPDLVFLSFIKGLIQTSLVFIPTAKDRLQESVLLVATHNKTVQ